MCVLPRGHSGWWLQSFDAIIGMIGMVDAGSDEPAKSSDTLYQLSNLLQKIGLGQVELLCRKVWELSFNRWGPIVNN